MSTTLTQAPISSSILARIMRATPPEIERLRKSGDGRVAFDATFGVGTKQQSWNFTDAVKLTVLWKLRGFLTYRPRTRVWEAITAEMIGHAISAPSGAALLLALRWPGTGDGDVKISVHLKSPDHDPDLPDVAVVVNLSDIVQSLNRDLRDLRRLGIVGPLGAVEAGLSNRREQVRASREALELLRVKMASASGHKRKNLEIQIKRGEVSMRRQEIQLRDAQEATAG